MHEEEQSQAYVVAAAVAIFRGGRVLALRRAADREAGGGLWETVSGRVKLGEEPVTTAMRETLEESGLSVKLHPRPVAAYAAARAGAPMIVIVYRADAGPDATVVRSDEHDADAWLTPEEFDVASGLGPLVQAVYAAARLGSLA